MGKKVNLAELANDDYYEPSPAPAVSSVPKLEPVPDGPSAPDKSATGAQAKDGAPAATLVPIDTVALNPLNKRPPGEDDEIADLAATIQERGVIQPLVVCSREAYVAEFPDQAGAVNGKRWIVLIGNRRLQAARAAGSVEVPILVNDESAASMYEVMLVENGQRRDLPPLLEAEAMSAVLSKEGISRRELARRIGKSHVYVAQRLALLGLIPELRRALQAGELKIELAREFGDLPPEQQEQIVEAGKPYRRLRGNGVTASRGSSGRRIRAATPAIAAESIRQSFSRDELAELIRLLTEAMNEHGER